MTRDPQSGVWLRADLRNLLESHAATASRFGDPAFRAGWVAAIGTIARAVGIDDWQDATDDMLLVDVAAERGKRAAICQCPGCVAARG